MSGIIFDTTISLGTMIHLVLLIVAVAGVVWKIRLDLSKISIDIQHEVETVGLQFERVTERFENMVDRIAALERGMNRVTEVLVVIGRQEERLNGLDRRVEHVERKFNGQN